MGYGREDLGNGRVRFTITPSWRENPTGNWKVAAAAGGFVGLVIIGGTPEDAGFLGTLFRWIVGAGVGVAVYRGVMWWTARRAAAGPGFSFVASPQGVVSGARQMGDQSAGREIPREGIEKLSVSNWSGEGTDGSSALYVDTTDGGSIILGTGMDEATAGRLLADASGVLGLAAAPAATAPADGVRAAAQARLEDMRRAHRETVVTSDTQSIGIGDLVLRETTPSAYLIERVTDGGREPLLTVPALASLVEVLQFAKEKAAGETLWFESLTDRGKPATQISAAR